MIYNAKSDTSGATSNFNYRKKITISHSGALTAYQVKLVINYVNTNMRTDFGDIRFNTDTGNYIPYWIETEVNSVSANVWIKADLVDGNTIIYMYYGNTGLTSASSVPNTFIREISGVIGAWKFDETSGNNVYESSGYNTLTANNTTIVTGKWGNARQFTGATDSRVEGAVTNLPLGSTARSMSAWFKISDATARHRCVIAYGTGIGGKPIYMIDVNASNKLYTESGSGQDAITSTSSVNDGMWHLAVLTYTGAGGVLSLYLDNSLVGSVSSITLATQLSNLGIGEMIWDLGKNFIGSVDEPRIYTSVLSLSGVIDLYDNYGYVTTNYAGKELVRKYTTTEPTYTTSAEQTITAKSMSINPRESPCRVGICVIDISVTWTNTGESAMFTPSIIVDSNTRSLTPRTLPIGDTPIAFEMSGLSVGNHTICPDPN